MLDFIQIRKKMTPVNFFLNIKFINFNNILTGELFFFKAYLKKKFVLKFFNKNSVKLHSFLKQITANDLIRVLFSIWLSLI